MTKLSDTQLIILSKAAARDDGCAVLPEGKKVAGAIKAGTSLIDRKLMREVRSKPAMPVWRTDEEGRAFCLVLTAAGRKAIRAEGPDEQTASDGDGKAPTTLAPASAKAASPDATAGTTASGTAASKTARPANTSSPVAKTARPAAAPKAASSAAASGGTASPSTPAANPIGPKALRETSKQALVVKMLSHKSGTTIDALVDATGWLPHTTRAALTGLRKRGFAIAREPQEGKPSAYRIAVPEVVATPPSKRRGAKSAPAEATV